ncbi:hypothetical protein [Amycolatopsis sp. PS_44_ISF1]|uniref:hypothetical protein n=1 Tax=Amycolatopsis sp. PS_44_ISF1 TaxID=2974917 RepID=UPI0028DF0ED0|nr:hypothetical protein [Amycolatopsis sp. PS_44_ISF1]MDT8911901.1 hypothetical protein [Amycolatopsis sp. PS_44_ISF1]
MWEVLADGVARLHANPDLVVAELGRAPARWCACADVVVCTTGAGMNAVEAWLVGSLLLSAHRGAWLAVVWTPVAAVPAFRAAG